MTAPVASPSADPVLPLTADTADTADGVADPAASPDATAGTWRAGTLVYNRAAIVALFFWLLLGDFAWSARERSIGPMAQWYLKHLGVSNLWFALIVSSLPSLMALMIGPIISYRSDRHRGPRGRRIPFVAGTTALAVLGMAGIALCPLVGPAIDRLLGAASPGTAECEIACFAFFWIIYEFASIAAQSVFNALINDVVPTGLSGRFFGLFRVVSLTDGIVFNLYLMGKVESHFVLMMLCVTGIYGLFMALLCRNVREGQYPPPPDVNAADGGRWVGAVRTFVRDCFGTPYFLMLFLFSALAGLAFTPVNTFAIPQSQNLDVTMQQLGQLYVMMFVCSFVLAYPVGWLADRLHPIRVVLASLAVYAVVMAWGGRASGTAHGFKVAFLLHGVVAGVYNTGIASLGQRLYPRSRFAQFASAAAIMWHVMNFMIGPLVGKLIDWHGSDYGLSYSIASGLSATAFVIGLCVYRTFLRLGGDSGYCPPLAEPS